MREDPYLKPAWASQDHVPVESEPCQECGKRFVVWVLRSGRGWARSRTLPRYLKRHEDAHRRKRLRAHQDALAGLKTQAANPPLEEFQR